MTIKKSDPNLAASEFSFIKVKGFGVANFVWHNTTVLVEETCLTVNHTRKILFTKGKQKTAVINFSDLDRVELKGFFSLGDLISGIIIAIISIATLQIWGLLGTVFLVLFSYGKKIVFIRKDGTKVIIQCGSLLSRGFLSGGGKPEFKRMIALLNTKAGRQVYADSVYIKEKNQGTSGELYGN